MPPYVEQIAERIHDRYAHRHFKQGILSFLREGSLLNLLTAPFIYSLLLPLALLDVCVTSYQWLCFPIYGICRVPRREYFVIDRHRLAYLNGIEKMNCTFCSYANGVVAYVREIAARTERLVPHQARGGDSHAAHAIPSVLRLRRCRDVSTRPACLATHTAIEATRSGFAPGRCRAR